jgi:DNA helicase-2/ATP-dependent DNA helicase PcrA
MDLLDGLNPEQQEAVQTVDGPLLVHAGPGSGKTRVIVHRIAYMVLQADINPRNILAVTFSKKAAEEMKKRLEELLGRTAPYVNVSTIHSACLRILRGEGAPGFGPNFEVLDEEEQNKLIKLCMENAGLELEENGLRRIKEAIRYAKTSMIDPESMVPGSGERFDDASASVYRGYQRQLKKRQALDYDDMLIYTHRLFHENAASLKKYQTQYKYILVDEFQDTSSLQYQLIKMLGAKYRNVCVVGDPDQTIYSWRQANIANIGNFRKDFPGTRVIGMQENYRSTGTIVDAANALIANNRVRKEKNLTTSREKGDFLQVVRLSDEEGEARFITTEISGLMKRRNLRYSDFAVLYRINAQSRTLEDSFNTAGLPCRLVSGTPFYKRKEVLDIVAWLRIMRNPSDDAAFTRIIKIAGKGIGPQALSRIYEMANTAGQHVCEVVEQASAGTVLAFAARTRRPVAQFHNLVEELRAESRKISLVTLMNLIIGRTGYQDYLKGEDNPEERWENVLELISVAGAYEHLSPLEALGALLQRISSATDAIELKQDADAVIFNTLHGSKGTEFPVVFMAGVEEGLLPHHRSMDDASRLEEERRLCYVGITRAMEMAYLTHVEKRCAYGEASFRIPSRFIREIPQHLIVTRDLAAMPGKAKPGK